MERPVVLLFAKDQEPAIVLPELELQKVASLPYKLQVFAYPENPSEWDGVFRRAVQSLGLMEADRRETAPVTSTEFRCGEYASEAEYPDARIKVVCV
jgi:hypothetical protein